MGGDNPLAWMGIWGFRVPPFFLTALAAVATLCVVQGGDAAAAGWDVRLGDLKGFAGASAVVLLVVAIWGALQALGSFVPILRGLPGLLPVPFIRPLAGIVAPFGPLLLLPIAVREWRNAGRPGRQSAWFNAVAVVTAVICTAGAVTAFLSLIQGVAPRGGMTAFDPVGSAPLKFLAAAAVLGALSLPALIAKMLDAGSPTSPAPIAPLPPPGGPSQGRRPRTLGGPPAAPAVFGRRGQRT